MDKSYTAADDLMDIKGVGATLYGASFQGGASGMNYNVPLTPEAAAMEGAASLSRTPGGFVVKEQQLDAPLLPTVNVPPPPNGQ